MILMALRMSHAGVRQDIAGRRKLKAECPHLCWQRGAAATRTGRITARYLQDYKSEEIIAAMKPKANVDYNICHPEKCSVDGVCPATRHCEKKILRASHSIRSMPWLLGMFFLLSSKGYKNVLKLLLSESSSA
jgi:hypothetical protein